MPYIIAVALVVAALLYYFIGRPLLRSARRKKVMAQAFPDDWREILEKNVSIVKSLPAELRKQLEDRVKVFVDEKNFIGCNGVEITDEIRITIAGQACLLILNRPTKFYPHLYTIYVYPSAYVSKQEVRGEDGVSRVDEGVRLGESWTRGSLVLAWDHSVGDAVNFHDGHNVVIHEFSHQLDQLSGDADGAPVLENRSCYQSWAKVLSKDYLRLRDAVLKHKKDVLDEYGATNPAEFFAVASEVFFEKPKILHIKHPELYDEFKRYYKVDPMEW